MSQLQPTETVAIADLKPHPRNYRAHPADQLEHLVQSLREHGLYRNIVVSRDGTILAGHGVVEAATELGWEEIAVIRLDVDPEDDQAIRVLTGDNELGRLAEVDDRLFSELLKELNDSDGEIDGLLGTGFDEQMLANLIYVTRPQSEIRSMDEAAHWAGMPDFGQVDEPLKIVVSCETPADRDDLMKKLGIHTVAKKTGDTWSAWWPPRDREDLSSLRFDNAT